jgi:hypothetical protein
MCARISILVILQLENAHTAYDSKQFFDETSNENILIAGLTSSN